MTGTKRLSRFIAFLFAACLLAHASISFAGEIIYTYDELNRLRTEKYPDTTTIEYIYDRLGNITEKKVTVPSVTIQAEAGTGGTISPSGAISVPKGNTATFTVTPNTGYDILSVTGCDGSLSGNTYTTGAITATCTVTASFALKMYTLNVSLATLPANAVGGYVSSSPSGMSCSGAACTGSYAHDTQVSLTAIANAGFDFTAWSGACTGAGACTITMDSAKNVTAEFKQTYTLTAIADPNGTVSAANLTPFFSESKLGEVWNEIWKYYKVRYGDSVTFTVTPNSDAVIAEVKADGSPLPLDNIRQSRSHTFENITGPHTIKGYFACENEPPPARIDGPTPVYYDSVQTAYNNAQNGNVIQTLAQNFTGDLTVGKSVTIDGGYGCSYKPEDRQGILSGIKGMVHVIGGKSKIKYFKLYK